MFLTDTDPQVLLVTAKGRTLFWIKLAADVLDRFLVLKKNGPKMSKVFPLNEFQIQKTWLLLRTQMITVGSIYLYSFHEEIIELAGTDDWEPPVFLLQTDVTCGSHFKFLSTFL